MFRRTFATALLVLIVVSLAQGSLALTTGYEEGSFPNRTFYVVRSSGPPRPNAFVTYVAPPADGDWWVRLVGIPGNAVNVQLYDLRPSPATLLVDSSLHDPGEESDPVRLERGVGYRLVFTAQGRPGTYVLAERFRYETNTPPVPCFTNYPDPAVQNFGIHFEAGCTTDAEGDIVAYAWDFGDGRVGSGGSVDTVYRSFGEFNVTLRVTDSAGNVAETSRVVFVYPEISVFAPPHVDFGVDEDGDGLIDVLVVQVHLGVGLRDPYAEIWGRHYRLTAYLELGDYTQWNTTVVSLPPGLATLELRFEGLAFRLSDRPGPYTVDMSLYYNPTNDLLDRDSHRTQAYLPDDFEMPPASFEPAHSDAGNDTDGDGRFNALDVDLGVRIDRAGTYRVFASLRDPANGDYIESAEMEVRLDPGHHAVRLVFPGQQINASRVSGPYRLDAVLLSTTLRIGSFTTYTQAYDPYAFNGPIASFFGTHGDQGIDLDGDGLYEYLEVNVSIVATRAVTADLIVSLTGTAAGNLTYYIETARTYVYLVEGLQRIPVRFRGQAINESRVEGPYEIELLMSPLGGTYRDRDSDRHTTRPYSYGDFLGAVATLADPPSDHGLDTDGDGRFNFLVIVIRIQVNIPALLRVTAILDDAGLGASNLTSWSVGLHSVSLRFDGVSIRANGMSRSFHIRYWFFHVTNVDGNETLEQLGEGEHWTGFYSYDQFEEPPAVFASPHADYGRDTDADGLFNLLVVEVRLQVTVADTYTVYAQLGLGWPSYRTLYAYNESELPGGSAIVRLIFDGTHFRISGRNQTFYMSLALWSTTHEVPFAWDSHMTRLYNFTEFEEIPVHLAPPYSDHGLDTDGDGLLNKLVVDIPVEAFSETDVWIGARLYTSRGSLYAFASSHVGPGFTVLSLAFDGFRIRELLADGPYTVELVLHAGIYGELERDRHMTAAYTAAGFDPALAVDLGRTTDRGEDADGDGAFDSLAVDVAVDVEYGGTTRIAAYIRVDRVRSVEAYAQMDLPAAGSWVLTVRFSGMALWGMGHDGTYVVDITVSRPFGPSVSVQYVTGTYLADSFQVPSAIFVQPFTETAVDTDGDGLYNTLLIDVTVEVTQAGDYSISACLDVLPDYCRVYDSAETALEPGTHALRFDLPGGLIRGLAADGPYPVRLRLSPTPPGTTSPEWIVYGSFETRAYRYDEFDVAMRFGTILDRGVDADSDGLYDSIEIQVELVFELAAWFTLEAYLDLEPYFTVYRRVDGLADVGSLTVVVRIEAAYFNTSGRDGPYEIRLVVFVLWLETTQTYLTAPYRASDFEA